MGSASSDSPSVDARPGRTPRMEPQVHMQRKKRRRRSSAARRRRAKIKRRIYIAVALLASVAFALVVLALVRLQKVSAELKVARSESQQAVDALEAKDLRSARDHLGRAADSFIRGRNALDSAFELKIAKMFPVAGPNLRAVSAMASAGASTADAGKNILDAARRLQGPKGELVFPLADGRVDLKAVEEIQPAVRSAHIRVEAAAAQVAGSPAGSLAGSVAGAREEMLEKLVEARDALAKLDGYLTVLPPFLGGDGPRRYLVAIGNNAEMNAEGMILSYGIIEANSGAISWSRSGPITEIKLSAPAQVPLSQEFVDRWSWANPTFAWQRANVSPEFSIVGEILTSMYKERTGQQLDGAIFIDGVALGYLLRATGPIAFQDPPVTLDERSFADFAMNGAYKSFASQEVRKEFLGVAAQRAITAAFQISGERARVLGSAFDQAARERRLMIYSRHAGEQASLAGMPIGGQLKKPTGGFFSYTLQNFSGSKLDYYMKQSIDYRSRVAPDGSSSVNVKMTLQNQATADLPEYILGGDEKLESRKPGDYFGYLTLYAPEGSFVTGGESKDSLLSVLPDAGHAAFSVAVLVRPGETRTVELEYRVPTPPASDDASGAAKNRFELLYVPQPRIRPDSIRAEVSFDSGTVAEPSGFAALGGRTLLFDGNPQEAVEWSASWRR